MEGTIHVSLSGQREYHLGYLSGPKPQMVELNLQPIDKEINMGSSTQSEWERNAQNRQQKMNWQNKMSKKSKNIGSR